MKHPRILYFFILISLVACSSATRKESVNCNTDKKTDSLLAEQFYASLSDFINRNPLSFDKNIKSLSDVKKNQTRFHFTKRVVFPLSLEGISFDYWSYMPCDGGCLPYNLLFIHNRSKSFLFPLTDDHIFWENSMISNVDSLKATNFIDELNLFIATFSIKQKSEESMLDIIMEFRNYERMGLEDIPKLRYIVSKISLNDNMDKGCKQKMSESISIAEKWISENKIVYLNGINILMFFSVNDEEWQMKSLNTECNKWVVF